MSIRAMNWAWSWPLAPAPKLILLALADIADDHGVCFPSVTFVARKVTLGKRATQRRIQELVTSKIIHVELRRRQDGSHTSNRYFLQLSRSQVESGGVETTLPDTVVTDIRVVNAKTRVTAQPYVPLTTNEPTLENTTEHGGGGDLIFPASWAQTMKAGFTKCLLGIPSGDAQMLLDELTGQMFAKSILSPLAYLRALKASYQKGEFLPEVAHRAQALRVAQIRQTESVCIAPQPSSRAAALAAIAYAKARVSKARNSNA